MSACDARAVGGYYGGAHERTLILDWNGKAWKQQTSPNVGGSSKNDRLNAVAAVSAQDAWAVGYYNNNNHEQALILHRNGEAWKQQTSPSPGGSGNDYFLNGVTAVSARNAWAVGGYYTNGAARGGAVQDSAYSAVWQAARTAALTPAQHASPLARRVYDLRHAAVSLWLNAGVPATEVARRAGHSVAVLLNVYAHCIDGQADTANNRIEEALDIDDSSVA